MSSETKYSQQATDAVILTPAPEPPPRELSHPGVNSAMGQAEFAFLPTNKG